MTIPLYSGRYSELARHLAARIATAPPAWSLGVLVPSRAASGEIVRALLELVPSGVATLGLYTPENLARAVVNAAGELPAVAGDLERTIAMVDAARSLQDSSLPPQGLEIIIDRSYRDVRDSGVSMQQLEERRIRRRPRHELLFRAARRYEESLQQMQLIDTADLLKRAVEIIAGGASIPRQVVFGFYDMTGVQQMLLRALAEAGLIDTIYFPLADPDASEVRFASAFRTSLLSMGAREERVNSTQQPTAIEVRRYQTPHEEVEGICRSIRELLAAGTKHEEIAIVCRHLDPEEAVLFERAASEEGFSVTPRFSLPLRAQRIGRAILRLLRMRESGFPRSWILEVLRDGLKIESVSGSQVDRLDRLTRRHGIAGGPPAVAATALEGLRAREAEAAEDLAPFVAATHEIESITAPFARPLSGPAWHSAILDLLGRFRAETDRDLQAIEEIESAAGTLLKAKVSAPLDASVVADLLDSLSVTPRRIEGPRVWFGDLMTMRGRSSTHVFAFGMQEDRFPQARVPDPILTDADRGALGLPQIGDGRDEERLLFELLVQSAATVHFSYAKTDGFGKVRRPSPFLPHPTTHIDSGSPQRPPHPTVVSPALARQINLVRGAGTRGEYGGYIDVDEAMQLEMRRRLETFSPTGFEDFGECPQKFLFRRLLRAEELEDPEHEAQINHLDKGSLDHRILERFYREASDALRFFAPRYDAALPGALSELLERIVEEEFDRFDREHPPFNEAIRGMERRFTRRNLERFLLHDIAELRERGLEPIHFEFTFGTDRKGPPQHPAISVELDSMSIAFRGSIDRIDRSLAKPYRYRVIDYKSGKAFRHRGLSGLIEAGHRLQLAIYAIAAEQIFRVEPDAISGAIKPIGSPDAKKDDFSFELAEHKEDLLGTLESFVESILSGRFPAVPDDDGACRYCPLGLGCRTRHDAQERRALRRFANALELLREEEQP